MGATDELFSLDQYRAADSVGYLLARSRTRLAKALDTALVSHHITHTQGGILLLLSRGVCVTAAELARELYIDSASMTRMIDRLEKRELIVRLPRGEDRRVVGLRLTKNGQTLARRLPAIYVKVLNQSFAGFTVEEISSLEGLLHKFLAIGSDVPD